MGDETVEPPLKQQMMQQNVGVSGNSAVLTEAALAHHDSLQEQVDEEEEEEEEEEEDEEEGQEHHVCFAEVNIKAGYDRLYDTAIKIGNCLLTKMGVPNVNHLNINIEENSKGINIEPTKKENDAIEFELKLEGSECCLVELSAKSEHHKLYKDEEMDHNEREIVLLRGREITVVPSTEILSSKTMKIHDIVFRVDVVDDYDQYNSGLHRSLHSKIHSFHNLLYSSNEYVFLPYNIWYLCVSWTQTTISGKDKKQQRSSKCSDDLYFNTDLTEFGIDTFKELKKFNAESQDVIDKLDGSNYLKLQKVHLQSLLQQINELRKQLSEQQQSEQTLDHNLEVHKDASKVYMDRLKTFEDFYQSGLNDIGDTKVKQMSLEQRLQILQSRIQNDENTEKEFAEKQELFQKHEIMDPEQKKEELQEQIRKSEGQIVRHRVTIREYREILTTLQHQIERLEISQTKN